MYRILIADDEPIERLIVQKIIKNTFKDFFEICVAENGREALEIFKKKPCEILILDIEMPGINGLEVAEMVRKEDNSCSIIFLTAFDEFDYAKKAINVKALDYLLKPTSEAELVATIEEALTQQKFRSAEILEKFKLLPTDQLDDEAAHDIRNTMIQKTIFEYIDKHFAEDIALQDIASELNYSEAYFCKVFKTCFEKSFIVYLTEFRVEKGRQLLADITVPIKEVSQRVGYRDSNYFTRVFKRLMKMTPTEYRNEQIRRAVLE
ncbi:MAG TPA: response regulator [Candidatus Dorea intestinavium]|nr:response regulator [Candidatus Dorea intestinavium]